MTRDRAERTAWEIGIAGIAGTAIAGAFSPQTLPHAWLAALTAWLGWPLGCMALTLIHALTGGRWGGALRPQLIGGTATIWLLVPALAPLALVSPSLYPWLRSDHALSNGFYLNASFLAGRTLIYAIVWSSLGWLIQRAFTRPDPRIALLRIAPPGLILLAITVTYASIDATMSLDPHFVSSAYGLVAIAEMGVFALSIAVLGATLTDSFDPIVAAALPDLGRLLLGLLVLWAYLEFMQFLIVWQSDLPDEAAWYLSRGTGDWALVAAAFAALQFILPFFALLSSRLQRSRLGMSLVAASVVIGAIVRSWWLVLPAAGRGLSITDLTAMLGVLCLAGGITMRSPLAWRHEAAVHDG